MTSRFRRRTPRHSLLAVATALVTAAGGCGRRDEPLIGTCGAYTQTPGTARVTAIESAPAGGHSCAKDPVRVLFDFTPTETSKASLAASGVPLTIGSGENPPRAWVTASGITVGSDLPATRSDQSAGPCSPLVFTLTSVDYLAGVAACY